MVAEQQPEPAVIGDRQPRHALGPGHFLENGVHIRGRLLKAAVGIALHHDAAALIQGDADAVAGLDLRERPRAVRRLIGAGRFGNGAAEILPPVRTAHLISDPHAVPLVDRQAGPGLERRKRADRNNRLGRPVVIAAQEHVVIAFFVAVPRDIDVALVVGRNGGRPMIGGGFGHGEGLLHAAAH